MLAIVNWVGRGLLCGLIGPKSGTDEWTARWKGTWTATENARNQTLAVGSLVLGFILGLVLYLIHYRVDLSRVFGLTWVNGLSSFLAIPVGAILFTFVIAGVEKEMSKRSDDKS